MILLLIDTDYYGPQVVGVYSDLQKAEQAIMNWKGEKVVWKKSSFEEGPANWFSVGSIEASYYEVTLDSPVQYIK